MSTHAQWSFSKRSASWSAVTQAQWSFSKRSAPWRGVTDLCPHMHNGASQKGQHHGVRSHRHNGASQKGQHHGVRSLISGVLSCQQNHGETVPQVGRKSSRTVDHLRFVSGMVPYHILFHPIFPRSARDMSTH